MTKTYELKLGNTEERSGHRRDCAQLGATVKIKAKDKPTALEKLDRFANGGRVKAGDVVFVPSYNLDRVTERDLKEV